MPAKIGLVAKSYLEDVALPQHGSTYTVISHKFVMDTVKEELNNHGFFIESESYRASQDGAVATGVYKLTHQEDPELSMAFAWTNSYNKMVKFKAVVGAISNVNDAFMILGDQGSWVRKHTGNADVEAKNEIINQIKSASIYYNQLLCDKDAMKKITLSKRDQSQLLGLLFADYSILESTTANIIKAQMIKPGFFYNGGTDTLWAFYNHLIFAIQDNHPKTWLEEQRMCHYIITNEFGLIAPVKLSTPVLVTPNVVEEPVTNLETIQVDLLESISEIEADEKENTSDNTVSETLQESSEDEVSQELYGVNNTNVETNFSLDIDEEEEEKQDENSEEEEEVFVDATVIDTPEVIETSNDLTIINNDELVNDFPVASVEDEDEDDSDTDFDFL